LPGLFDILENMTGKNDKYAAASVLPMTRREMERLGWDQLDVLLISGDAYVDHPSFGIALIGRVLQQAGFRVGIVAGPDWNSREDFERLGRPRLFVGIGSGAVDSMMNLYTAARKKRRDDVYQPGGKAGMRPARASIVYANRLRECFPELPIVLGGVEASLRRYVHYDYWKESIRRSILLDARADIIVYGHGERQIVEIAERLHRGDDIADIPGTAINLPLAEAEQLPDAVVLSSYEEIKDNSELLAEATKIAERETNPYCGKAVVAPHGDRAVVCYPPPLPMPEEELDAIYELPFTRVAHPSYTEKIPALEPVKDSVTIVRGCCGGCSFCSLSLHQGKQVVSRSLESVLREVEKIAAAPGFKGTISDLGGPTANLWGAACGDDQKREQCRRPSCLYPERCKSLIDKQDELVRMYRLAARIKGVKHLFIASGIRHDLALDSEIYLKELIAKHVGGHLKVAPEHMSSKVLALMRKPQFHLFELFLERFGQISAAAGKKQYLVPYFISGFPGENMDDITDVGRWLKMRNWRPQQVQEFIPSPGTVATAMWVSAIDPQSGKRITVNRSDAYRKRARACLDPGEPAGAKVERAYTKSAKPRKKRRLVKFEKSNKNRPDK
jgi:uncharacterized radical SAM protein YgiQ